MPVLPYSLRSIYQASGDKEHLKEFLYPLVNYFKWWRNTRDSGDGLITAIHNWETGKFNFGRNLDCFVHANYVTD